MSEQGKKSFFRGLMDRVGGGSQQGDESPAESVLAAPGPTAPGQVQEKPKGEP